MLNSTCTCTYTLECCESKCACTRVFSKICKSTVLRKYSYLYLNTYKNTQPNSGQWCYILLTQAEFVLWIWWYDVMSYLLRHDFLSLDLMDAVGHDSHTGPRFMQVSQCSMSVQAANNELYTSWDVYNKNNVT